MTCGLMLAAHSLQASPISLGAARDFGVLGASTVTNTGSTVVFGELGVSPGSAITGFPHGTVLGGSIHLNDTQAVQAHADALVAYTALAGTALTMDYSGTNLGTLTLTPGTYHFSSAAELSGTLTLDNRLDPQGAYYFQIGSTLNTGPGSKVILLSGSDDNIFWQVGSSATLAAETEFRGSLIAYASIIVGAGTDIFNGRMITLNGAITLESNQINLSEPLNAIPEPGCWIFGALLSGLGGTRKFGRSFIC